ncbi:MAG: COX15/CtaA family protein [Candidatus Kapabacteria bacterium]|nr:COX15/CtaA family protein [Candidatus Kapabacteria bacterium]
MKTTAFQKSITVTITLTILLIGVGGLVRATGSGLGCPDWPKCFGLWVPPTSVDLLPPQYNPQDFNVLRTWTEYLNRLFGVIVGFSIIVMTALSIPQWKIRKTRTIFSILTLLLVMFQGWLGAVVVKTELLHWVITLHMIVAMILLGTMLVTKHLSYSTPLYEKNELSSPLRKELLVFFLCILTLTMAQVVLGTQVREEVDIIVNSTEWKDLPREFWLIKAGTIHEIHRSFSWSVFLLTVFLFVRMRRAVIPQTLKFYSVVLGAVIMVQMLVGIVLSYFHLPPVFQILHLVLAAILIATVLHLIYMVTIKQIQLKV